MRIIKYLGNDSSSMPISESDSNEIYNGPDIEILCWNSDPQKVSLKPESFSIESLSYRHS